MVSKYKKSGGWFSESSRHSLSAKGVKTGRKSNLVSSMSVGYAKDNKDTKVFQVNRLRIKYSKMYDKWQVIAPDKRVLEEFDKLGDAKLWAGETKDFVSKSDFAKKYDVSLGDDGSLDTIIYVNGKEIRYDTEFASQFRNHKTGAITEKGWKELKKQAISDFESTDYAKDTYKLIDEKKFKSRVVKETAYGIVNDYGMKNNTMQLVRTGDNLQIEWNVGDDEDYVEIGIETVGKDVTGYDGVFELPKQALQLLKKNGYNTKEVE
jgi:hypothetical protein